MTEARDDLDRAWHDLSNAVDRFLSLCDAEPEHAKHWVGSAADAGQDLIDKSITVRTHKEKRRVYA